jgi:hypothetical protein
MYSQHIAPTLGAATDFSTRTTELDLAVQWRSHGDVEAARK